MSNDDRDLEQWKVDLAAYRQSLIKVKTLPTSGLKFHMKQVGLEDLILQGNIPDSLSGLVERVMDSGDKEIAASDVFQGSGDLDMVAEMYAVVIKACVVFPPVADEADDEHLAISEIPFKDREAIFNWANGDAEALKPFRPEPEGPTD